MMDNTNHLGNVRPQKSLAVKEMAAQYRDSLDAVGGDRLNILELSEGWHVSKGAKKWYKDKLIIFASLGFLVVGGYLFTHIQQNLVTLSAYAVFTAVCVFFHIRNITVWQSIENKKQESRVKFSRYFEPDALWGMDYPVKGEKGELITAILGSRKNLNIIESSTTLPIHVPSRDPYYMQMIKTIIESKEDDISPYIYDEVNYLCESTKQYILTYLPLINLEIELQMEHLRKSDTNP